MLVDGPEAGTIVYFWPEFHSEYNLELVNVTVYTDFRYEETVGIWLGAME